MQPLLQWKTLSVTNSECVFVALGTQGEMRMRSIFNCGLFGSPIFFYISSPKVRFSKKKMYRTQDMCVAFFTAFVRNISHSKKN
jgi:hypothetical protein